MEYLRNDTGNHSQCANTDLFALLFFNLLSPLMSILVASLGYKIYRIGTDVSEKKNV